MAKRRRPTTEPARPHPPHVDRGLWVEHGHLIQALHDYHGREVHHVRNFTPEQQREYGQLGGQARMRLPDKKKHQARMTAAAKKKWLEKPAEERREQMRRIGILAGFSHTRRAQERRKKRES